MSSNLVLNKKKDTEKEKEKILEKVKGKETIIHNQIEIKKTISLDKEKDKDKDKEKEKEKKCENHNLNYFVNKALKSKNIKDYYFKFCHYCNGLFIYDKEKKIINTVSNLNEEITPNYFNPFFIFQEAKKNYQNENLIYVNTSLKYRKDMLNFVFKLKNKYKVSSDTYFLAIRLIDIVCSKIIKFEIDLELISIACFFLACNLYIYIYIYIIK